MGKHTGQRLHYKQGDPSTNRLLKVPVLVGTQQSSTLIQNSVQSNEQSLHVGALWVIFMTASRNGDKQICSF